MGLALSSQALFGPAERINTSLWETWSTGVTWVDVQVGDFNGDGKADIVGRADELGTWWVGQSTGSNFNSSPSDQCFSGYLLTKPSRFGMRTLGSVSAFMTSFSPMILASASR